MRTFNFNVTMRESASGHRRITDGSNWYRLATRLARKGCVKLVMNSKTFAGYGSSYDVGYTNYNFSVTELPGNFN